MTAEALEIDKRHKAKRVRNIKIACVFIYTLIFAVVLSLGHSLKAEHELFVSKQAIQQLTDELNEMAVQNEYLRKVIK